ncbi:MAG TPA: methylaspartate mutase subunit E, partial [Petrimonas sp.]|nr:methylaspartate mutase subunit E [Petrimonas sp.]
MEISNKKLSTDAFFAERKEVLGHWHTGKGVDFDEAVAYQRSIPREKRFGLKLAQAAEQNVTLIQPRAGVALYEEHIELLRFLESEGEADLLPTTVDSYTRLNRYNEAETGIEKSKETGRSMLNGFPIVNYGVDICRKVTSSLQ